MPRDTRTRFFPRLIVNAMNSPSQTPSAFRWVLLLGVLLAPALAEAHPIGMHATGMGMGFLHPLTGLDHLCAMVAVGLWASQRGGRSLWMIPLAFVGVMTLGGILGVAGVALPFVEKGIMASVLVLGVLVAAAVRLPLVASVLLVGLFALFHGHAHGAEMPATASGATYALGFALSTASLHLVGIGIGLASRRFLTTEKVVRYAGGAIAAYGAYMIATL